jgi:RNA polymerase sigma-70 factor, ECF subfamily
MFFEEYPGGECKLQAPSVINYVEGMRDDDRELLARIQQGDSESFGTLYDRTRNWLLSFVIVPRVGRAHAEEVLSETYLVALQKIHSFRWQGIGLLHWLATIARRKALEHGRRHGARDLALDDVPSLLELPDDVPTTEAEMIHEQTLGHLQSRVAETLGRLQPRYADVLRLRLLDNRPRTECAERLGVSVTTLDVVLYRATRAFAREWSRT